MAIECKRHMNHFSIFAHGVSFDVDAYLATSPLHFDHVWRREQKLSRLPAGSKREPTSGAELVLGDGAQLAFDEQQVIAADFLSKHVEALRDLAKFPGVETFILALRFQMELEPSTVGFCVSFSSDLMRQALEVGVEPVCYVVLDWDKQWADKLLEYGL